MKEARDELVRIDQHGQVHPIGPVAGQRLRARKGAFRILPGPPHVVLMRYTGEDGRRDDGDGAVVRLAGEISRPGAMCEIFGLLAQSGWRGQLVVFDGKNERSLFFEQSNVVGASTTCERERLGEVMYRFGAITREQLGGLLQKKGGRIGTLAVEHGYISQERVFSCLRKQIEEVVHTTLMAADGTFFFLDGFEDDLLVSRQAISANALLLDGLTRLDEIRYFREKIPSSDYVPQVSTDAPHAVPTELSVTFGAVDGLSSILELGRVTGRGEFETTRDVYTMLRSKHLRLAPPRISGGLTAIVTIANEVLRQVHSFVDANGKGSELRAGLASFASGAGVYDVLFRGAGPAEDGSLQVERVAENLNMVTQQAEEHMLRQMLHEYVGFGLFSVGAALGSEREDELKALVGAAVFRLQPPG